MPTMTTRFPILAGLLAALLAAASGHAQTASLVADLATTEDRADGSHPDKLTAVRGGRVVFEAREDRFGDGRDLWGSDGTAEGTMLLADGCPGSTCGSHVTFHGTLNGVALVAGPLGRLLVSDGTREGTFPLRDSGDGGVPLEGGPGSAIFGGFFYLDACGRPSRCGLWRTDGTLEGTRLLVSRTRLGGEIIDLAATDQALFFTLYRSDSSALLWRTDGTAAGTVRLETFRHPARPLPEALTPVGSKLFFVGPGHDGQELWVSDGTRAGTRPVTNFRPRQPFGDGSPSEQTLLFAEENRVDFAVNDGVHGWEIWQNDGTPEGTRRITDFPFFWDPFWESSALPLARVGGRLLVPALNYANAVLDLWATDGRSMVRLHTCLGGCDNEFFFGLPRLLVSHRNRVLFTAGAGSGQELWSTDGTPAGTRKLLNACTGACDSTINLTSASLDGRAVFEISADGKNQLWATDGTAAGTRPLFHLPPGTSTGAPPVASGAKVFFGAADEDGMELWVREGGQERQVANLIPEAASSSPTSLVALGPHLVFQAGSPLDTRGLWQSEGTATTTSRILDSFRLPTDCHFSYCSAPMAAADGWLALVNTPRDEVNELWRTDGTAAGTFRLLAVEAPDRLQRLAAFQDTVVFFVERPHHLEIWRSDGTPAGTYRIADKGDMEAAGLGGTGTEVHFQLGTQDSLELWRSDGTMEGTVRVAGLPRGPGGLLDAPPVRVGHRVVFELYKPSLEQLWSTDGTEEGTVLVMEAEEVMDERKVLDGQLYFSTPFSLWRSDGTAAGTVHLRYWGYVPSSLTAFAGRLFFAAGQDFESELWSTDGTRAGTRRVLAINPYIGSDPTNFAVFGDRLYFSAFDPAYGYELWQTDGTAGGTRLVQDIFPGGSSSSPDQLTVAGGRLYFTANDGVRGRELWSLSLETP